MFKHKRVCTADGPTRQKVGAQGEPNILRTVHMPSESASQTLSETQKLNAQIEQNRMRNEQVINRLRDEKCEFEESQRERYLAKKVQIDQLIEQIQQQETLN